MQDARHSKRCNICMEPMDSRAMRCPHCAQWQSRLDFLGRPTLALVLIAVMLVLWPVAKVSLMLGLFPLLGAGEDFAPHRDELRVVQSEMHFGRSPKGPVVTVVGRLRNEGERAWKSIAIEVRFRDGEGTLVDAAEFSDWVGSRSLAAGGERAFKVQFVAELPLERYRSFEASVRSARDARAL